MKLPHVLAVPAMLMASPNIHVLLNLIGISEVTTSNTGYKLSHKQMFVCDLI